MDKSLKYRLVVWAVALFLAFLLPSGINSSSQIQKTSIATAIGLDKSENELEVSVQVVVPQPGSNYSPKYVIATAKGKNLPEAIENIELKLGQEIGLAHCFVIVLGDKVCEDNLASTLDYLMRSNIMGNNSALLHTDGKAKELLEQSSKLSESDVNNLQHIAKYNQEHYSSSNTDLVSFFNAYASNCPFCVVGSLNVDDSNSSQSQEQGQSQQNQGQEQNKGGSDQKVLKNEGEAIVFKNGKKLTKLKKEDLNNFGWLDSKAQKGFLILEHVSNDLFDDATITLHIKNKSVNFSASLENNIPVLTANIFFEAFVESIEDGKKEITGAHQNLCTQDFQEQIDKKIKEQISDAIKLSKEKNFDIIGVFNVFNTKNHKKWKEFLQNLANPEDYMQEIEVISNISMHHKL